MTGTTHQQDVALTVLYSLYECYTVARRNGGTSRTRNGTFWFVLTFKMALKAIQKRDIGQYLNAATVSEFLLLLF